MLAAYPLASLDGLDPRPLPGADPPTTPQQKTDIVSQLSINNNNKSINHTRYVVEFFISVLGKKNPNCLNELLYVDGLCAPL